jgi:ATP-dependent helicase/nuclease subunit B
MQAMGQGIETSYMQIIADTLGVDIDRIDIVQDRAEAAVIDYKLSGGSVSVQAVYHGLSLQLLVYLLVLQASGQQLAGRPLTPAAAFYVKMLRRLSDVAHPDDAIDPSDERFEVSVKPRGLFDARCLDWLDRTCAAGSYSEVVQAYRTRDGSVSDREGYDAVETRQFRDLLELARARLAELADQIMSGRIDIAPYRLRGQSPCSSCAYADVCRFDPTINRYHHLTAMSRQQVFEQLAGGEHA